MEMKSRRSAMKNGRLKRKALSDLTNTVLSHGNPKPQIFQPISSSSSSSDLSQFSVRSRGPKNLGDRRIVASPAISVANSVITEKSEHSKIYEKNSLEKRKGKEEVVAAPVAQSHVPMNRIRSIEDRSKMGHRNILPSVKLPVHPQETEKRFEIMEDEDDGEPILPQEFIEKQRAYFAEIDAFELREEVVSESELE